MVFVCAASGAQVWTDEQMVVLSGPASPRVAMGIRRVGPRLEVAVDVDREGESAPQVSIGVAAAKSIVLRGERPQDISGGVRYVFSIPPGTIALRDWDWQRLRLGISVVWPGGAMGQDRQRERFRHIGGAPHEGLSTDPSQWLPLNLVEHALAVEDRKNRAWVQFDQPVDGKATIVIEDAQGRRVRNLIAGRAAGKGPQRVEWDGVDDEGRVAAPGAYRWRSVHHPGIRPVYLFSFCNDGVPSWRTGSGMDMWGPDHSVLSSATSNSKWSFFGGSCAESGYAVVAVDVDGIKRMHYNAIHGTGIEAVQLAADEKYLYAAHDGFAWGQNVDRSKPNWKAEQALTLTRFDIATGRVVDYSDGKRFVVLAKHNVGPGAGLSGPSLRGMVLAGGKLYVSDYHANRLIVVDPATGRQTGQLPIRAPGPLAADGTDVLAVSGDGNVSVYQQDGAAGPLPITDTGATGIAVYDRRIYVSNGRTHTVEVYDRDGRVFEPIGKPGGAYGGPFDPQRMVNPGGLTIAPNGWLWVTEDRWDPKRLVAWDLKTRQVVKQKFGPTSYGASGAGFDYADHARWIGQGALWSLDFATKSAAPRSILRGHGGHGGAFHYTFYRQDGRTFLIGFGGVASISELKPDGTKHDLATVGSTHRYSFACDWKPPRAFIDAFNKTYPSRQGSHADKGPGFLWLDRNGDGRMQVEEFEFSTSAEHFAGSYWGHDSRNLTLRLPVTANGKRLIVTLKPEGYNATGAPAYPSLNAAIAAGVPIDLSGNEIETATDRFGNLICNSEPQMKAFSPDGKLIWTYPNRWTNVHGSHSAPLPEVGQLQGALFFLGMANLDEQADVFVMNGNHGRFFILSSDGMFLDEMFKDVRMGGTLDAQLIGGECFGGVFGRSEKDGNYYLQSGHTDYRLFRIDGLRQVTRQTGAIRLSPAQVIAAERRLASKLARASAGKVAQVQRMAKAIAIDGKGDDWPGEPAARWDQSKRFPASVCMGYDDRNLYLFYTVSDESPWINRGKDWTLLFKTGDSVDLQLGADWRAVSDRSQPVIGDLRLLIAPFEEGSTAVLYRHRLAVKDAPVTFTSPWRSETVDSVKRLDGVAIAVMKDQGGYRVEAAIPLETLGLHRPAGQTLRGDFGVIRGDPAGTINMFRSYWANANTMLVNDVPGEIMLMPKLWGEIRFEGAEIHERN